MVKLRLYVTHSDKCLEFEKDGFELPPGVTWHAGLWVDGPQGSVGGSLQVAAVYILHDKTAEVVFEETYHSVSSPESITDFTEDGWKFIASTPR